MEHPQSQPGHVVPPPVQFPPDSYPPVALVYHQPLTIPRPTGVTVLAIIGIVLAALWILTGLGGALSFVLMFTFVTPAMMPPNFGDFRAVIVWNGVSAVISGLIAGWLLAVAIGCLRMRPWGRSGMVRYAQIDLAWIGVKLLVAVAWAIPVQQRWQNSIMNTTAPTTAPTAPGAPPGPATAPAAMSGSTVVVIDDLSTNTTTAMTTTSTATVTVGGRVSTTPAAAMTTVGLPFDEDIAPWVIAFVTALVSVIYPVAVIVYMTRPRIKGAFTPVAPGSPGSTDVQQN